MKYNIYSDLLNTQEYESLSQEEKKKTPPKYPLTTLQVPPKLMIPMNYRSTTDQLPIKSMSIVLLIMIYPKSYQMILKMIHQNHHPLI